MLEKLWGECRSRIEAAIEPEVLQRLARLNARLNEYGVDPFGFDPEMVKLAIPVASFLYREYFRVQTYGLHHLPPGRVLLISNHSGQIPLDAMMIISSVFLEAEPPRFPRAMVEKWVPTLPLIGYFFQRAGQIVGTRENCARLLEREEAILVFPEGVKGISKTFDRRYQLESFGQGFMRLALECRAPILPVAVVGAEEQAPTLFHLKTLAKMMGFPALPVTLTFPWLGPLGMLPLPVRYRIFFGQPIWFEGDPDEEDAVVEDMVKQVRGTIQRMLHDGLKAREHVFW